MRLINIGLGLDPKPRICHYVLYDSNYLCGFPNKGFKGLACKDCIIGERYRIFMLAIKNKVLENESV